MPTPKLFTTGTISVDTPPTNPLPQFVLSLVRKARAAGKSDFEIVDLLRDAGVHRPSYYGFTDHTSDGRWPVASIAALRAQFGIA